jgi:dCTP deaminase
VASAVTLLHQAALLDALADDDLDNRLIVTPMLDPVQTGEASIDLRLGTEFLLLQRTLRPGVDISDDLQPQVNELYGNINVPLGEGLWLHPQQFALGATFEFIRLPMHLGAYVLGRSSWGRLGLLVATAVMVQPGFSGSLTLELVNAGDSPVKLFPGLKIAQLAVHSLSDGASRAYEGRYRSPTGPQAARLDREQDELARIQHLGDALSRP